MTVLEDATPVLLEEALTSAALPVAGAKAVHVVSAALKVFVTDTVSNFVEEVSAVPAAVTAILWLPAYHRSLLLTSTSSQPRGTIQSWCSKWHGASYLQIGSPTACADDAWDADLLVFTEATAPAVAQRAGRECTGSCRCDV